MKITLKIAKLELQRLFYSPISWVVLIIFAFYSGITLTGIMDGIITSPARPGRIISYTFSIFQRFFSGFGYFRSLQGVFFMFIPLLTMGLVSNEMNSGTIKLLYSSPVKIWSIVLGKYLAILVFSLALVGFMVTAIIGVYLQVPELDWGMVIPGLFGLFLLTSTYCAIGLFMSTLSRYQVVSGLATFTIFYVLDYIAEAGATLSIIGDALAWLSITGHTNNLLQGLLISTDLLYYVIMTVLFLGFAISKMSADRMGKQAKLRITLYSFATVLIAGFAVFFLTQPSMIYFKDFTYTQTNGFNREAKDLLKRFDHGSLKVTNYKNAAYERYPPSSGTTPMTPKTIQAIWSDYVRYLPNMEFLGQYYYGHVTPDPQLNFDNNPYQGEFKSLSPEERAKKYAYYHNLDFDQFLSKEQMTEEAQKGWFQGYSRPRTSVTYLDKEVFLLSGFDDYLGLLAPDDNYGVLQMLLDDAVKIHFLTGQGERRIDRQRDADWNRTALEKRHRYGMYANGFRATIITLDELVPEEIDVLVIADPSEEFEPSQLDQIADYLEAGGNLWVAAEGSNAEFINPILELLGVGIASKVIENDDPTTVGELMPVQINSNASEHFFRFKSFVPGPRPVFMDGASPLRFEENKGFTVQPLLTTNATYTWLSEDSIRQSFVTGLTLTRKQAGKDQKILVLGDADLFADKEMRKNIPTRAEGTGNSFFLKNILSWFSDGIYPFKSTRIPPKDVTWRATVETVKVYKVIYIWVLPLLMVAMGSVIFMRRRRK